MSESQRIANQVKQAFDGEAWHGPPIGEILRGIDARTAHAKPITGAHSIIELVLHLIATQKLVLRRIAGDHTAINPPPEEEWPSPADASEQTWQAAVSELRRLDLDLRQQIDAFPDGRLDQALIPGGSSAYNTFHGYVQHNLYHAAQISLLRKAQGR